MDHGEGQAPPFLDVKLGHPDVQTGRQMRRRGTPGDDVHLGPFFNDNDVVHILGETVLGDIQTGLHRLGHLDPGLGADEIAFGRSGLGMGRDLVLFRGDMPPQIVVQPPVFGQRLVNPHNLQTVLLGAAVDHAAVHLDKGAGPLAGISADPHLEKFTGVSRGHLA